MSLSKASGIATKTTAFLQDSPKRSPGFLRMISLQLQHTGQ